MKIIAIGMSLVIFIYLSMAFFTQQSDHQHSKALFVVPKAMKPAYIGDAPLKVEQEWQKLKVEQLIPKDNSKVSTDVNKDILSIGEQEYVLYGVFNAANSNELKRLVKNQPKGRIENDAFILIKALNTPKNIEAKMLKVIEGEELSKGVTLAIVTSNSISFKQDDELVEFKLFKAKK